MLISFLELAVWKLHDKLPSDAMHLPETQHLDQMEDVQLKSIHSPWSSRSDAKLTDNNAG